ncbi:hypothetical protein CAPTEDRAFT_194112 [Capitella teleta]|uniref:G-protein coupled receptors family 1 profile domain-containing protein n=1 Tax=Capitella teleta TaxID=283909 RepID=R7UCE5_CAPTE|nr:hypothetical protein CAPTEDRAFT_194112 [Capitella teleta]|eukprot:ELU00917.1 hypothetical protein CAPTEDRAFT_194112 [Capitella teleta]
MTEGEKNNKNKLVLTINVASFQGNYTDEEPPRQGSPHTRPQEHVALFPHSAPAQKWVKNLKALKRKEAEETIFHFAMMNTQGISTPPNNGVDICVNCSNKSEVCDTEEEYIIYLYIYTPLAILGLILNVLNIVIFRLMKYKNSTLTFLILLAVCDLLYLASACPIGPVRCILKKDPLTRYSASFYENYVYLPLANIFGAMSNWATVVLALDRTVHIIRSTRAQRASALSSRWQCVIAGTISIGSVVINIPYFFYGQIDENGDLVDSSLTKENWFQAYTWLRFALIKIIPIVSVAVCNTLLIRLLVVMNRQRKTMVPQSMQSKTQSQQIRVCSMLISISVVFLVCHLIEPLSHSSLYGAIFGESAVYSESHYQQIIATNLLEMICHGINFWFYCVFTPKFFGHLKSLFCCCTINVGVWGVHTAVFHLNGNGIFNDGEHKTEDEHSFTGVYSIMPD